MQPCLFVHRGAGVQPGVYLLCRGVPVHVSQDGSGAGDAADAVVEEIRASGGQAAANKASVCRIAAVCV